MEPAEKPYAPGDVVHVRRGGGSNGRTHRFACEVLSVSEAEEVNDYTYTLFSLGWERILATTYRHSQLYPSPRGYPNIDDFLGDGHVNGEKLLGTLKRHDLEVIDEWLRVVDNEVHATKNWFNELRNEEIDRINSVFAELVLLYHLRKIYGNDCVSLNSRAGAKEFDLRLTTEQEDVWIKVTMPEFTEGLLDSGERKTLNTTQNSMERKLESTLEETRNRAPEDAVLVLAIYCEEQINQSYATQLELDEGHYDTGEVCDGWLYYTHLRDTQIEYQPVSDAGERVRTLVNRMVEE